MHWPIEGFPAEKAQASVEGSHWPAPKGRKRMCYDWSKRTPIPRMAEGHHCEIRNRTYYIRVYFTGEMKSIKVRNMMVPGHFTASTVSNSS